MSKPEFPPELIERCREKVWPTEHVDDAIVAVLRECRYAELVTALKSIKRQAEMVEQDTSDDSAVYAWRFASSIAIDALRKVNAS